MSITAAEYQKLATKPKKYRNKSVVIDGIRFDSIAESKRYEQLRLLQQYHKISGLELQPKYDLCVGSMKICGYRADFRYRDESGKEITEDVKGFLTPVYRIKKRLMKACRGIEIVEVM